MTELRDTAAADPFHAWYEALERRCRARLTFPEIRRALQAISSFYVERRGEGRYAQVLNGEGKRSAFALFYGSLHFLLVREIVRELGLGRLAPQRLFDLGCGTGVAGAAWALEGRPRPSLVGIDKSGWAVKEARWTLRELGLVGSVRREALEEVRLPGTRTGVVVAFTANELEDAQRARLLENLLAAGERGAGILVVEPISRRAVPWWRDWRRPFEARGGREDFWSFRLALPDSLRLLDKAAGLDHQLLKGRSLWLGPKPPA